MIDKQLTETTSHPLGLYILGFVESRGAPATRAAYARDISSFAEWVGVKDDEDTFAEWVEILLTGQGTGKLLALTPLHAAAYLRHLEGCEGMAESPEVVEIDERGDYIPLKEKKQEPLAQSTIRRRFAALRALFSYLQDIPGLHVGINPFSSSHTPVKMHKEAQKQPTIALSAAETKAILSAPNTKKREGKRDAAILHALFGGALRTSELIGLNVGDVRRETRTRTPYLYLRSTKAGGAATVPLNDQAAAALFTWQSIRRKEAGQGEALFIAQGNAKAARISRSTIVRLLRKYASQANIAKRISPHSARATAITRLLDQGYGIRDVMQFSRHSSLQTLQMYDKRRVGLSENVGTLLSFEED